MRLGKVISTKVAFFIVLLWVLLTAGLLYWQWGKTIQDFEEAQTSPYKQNQLK